MASEAPVPAPEPEAVRTERVTWLRSGPFAIGFIGTLGVLLALLLGAAVAQLAYTITLIFLATFISLGLYPVVTRLQQRGLSKGAAIGVVLAAFLAVVAAMLFLIVPIVIEQATELARTLPENLTDVNNQPWFIDLDEQFNGYPLILLEWIRLNSADPNLWLTVGGGALRIGADIINGTFGVLLVVVITIYFVASLDVMKNALYDLVPGSKRAGFAEIAEEIFDSIGKYLSGQVIIAVTNATFSFILLTIMGVRYAGILAFIALFITLIPVVGSVISTTLMVLVSLFTSPAAALVVGIVMIVYMQLEAYLLTPRIIGKAIKIPASLVLIGAVIGGTLLGLLGALVASPVVASILLILKKVVVPRQRVK
jgi:predicted PurR-regulated permease PerM